jgi:hypothetical protein
MVLQEQVTLSGETLERVKESSRGVTVLIGAEKRRNGRRAKEDRKVDA